MLLVRLNQLAAGGSGVDPAMLDVLAEVLNRGARPAGAHLRIDRHR
ncbi:hypothetical protein [Carbonactinospora thermoautotrophica]